MSFRAPDFMQIVGGRGGVGEVAGMMRVEVAVSIWPASDRIEGRVSIDTRGL